MATLEEVVYTRRNNPLTLSLFFKGKDRDVFTMLYGEKRWLDTRYMNMSRATHFDFERAVPMPDKIKERREKILTLLQGEINKEKVKELWRLTSDRSVPSTATWTMAKWGVGDTNDIHLRFSNLRPDPDGEVYLQLTFMGLITLPFALLCELDYIGLKYDAIWINDVEQTYGVYSSPNNDDSYFCDDNGRVYDLEQAYRLIYDVDVVDQIDAKAGLIWVRDLFTLADDQLKTFLIKHPVEEWNDGCARVFFIDDEDLQRDCALLDKLITYVNTRNDFLREEIWEAELACSRLVKKLFNSETKDLGFAYYRLRQLVDYGLAETEKQLAG